MNALIVFGAKYLWLIIAVGFVGVLYAKKELRIRLGIIALISLPVVYGLARVLGMFYSHPQPFAVEGFVPLIPHEVDNAFPSDHVAIAGVLATVGFLADRKFGLFLWALTLLVGLSRMLASVHWGIDVIASALLAMATVAAVDFAVKKVWA